MRKTFGKSERLTNFRVIKDAFKFGKNYFSGCLRIIVFPLKAVPPTKSAIQVLISVPRKNIKKPVDRNRIKRQLREVYRLNKDYFFKNLNNEAPLALIIVYNSKAIPKYSDLNQAFLKWIRDTFVPNNPDS